jgi:hypothetical protein
MRGDSVDVEEYLVRVAALLERYGIALRLPEGTDELEVLEDPAGALSFELLGDLPDAATPSRSEVIVREQFDRVGPDRYARAGYEYEILDRERGYRRSFHLHDPEWFQREFLVVVHEHCESPIGRVPCKHYEGPPIKDAYAGVEALMDVWTGPPPDCSRLTCLG